MNSIGKDLARIRHHLNFTHDDIYQKIRIPSETLKRIENGSIFRDKSENKVYVRSFVRTYAKALKIDDALVQKALDQQEEGTYDRLLLTAYPELAEQVNPPHPLLDGDEEESDISGSSGSPGSSGEDLPPAEKKVPPALGSTEKSASQPPASESAEDPASHPPASESAEDPASQPPASESAEDSAAESRVDTPSDTDNKTGSEFRRDDGIPASEPGKGESPDRSKRPGEAVASEPKVGTPEHPDAALRGEAGTGSALSGSRGASSPADPHAPETTSAENPPAEPASAEAPPAGREPEGFRSDTVNWAAKGHNYKDRRSGRSGWIPIGVAALVIVLIAITIFLLTGSSWTASTPDPSGADPRVELESDAGDLQLNLVQNEQNETTPPAAAELDGTLYLMVYAAHSQLDPVRIWSDLKPRFDPCWQEHGEAYLYEFSDSVQVRGNYEGMMLFLNGHRIDDFQQRYYREETDAVVLTREHFSSDPEWAQSVPVELPQGVSAPDTIRHRPTFTTSANP